MSHHACPWPSARAITTPRTVCVFALYRVLPTPRCFPPFTHASPQNAPHSDALLFVSTPDARKIPRHSSVVHTYPLSVHVHDWSLVHEHGLCVRGCGCIWSCVMCFVFTWFVQEFMRMVLPKDLKYKISCYS